MSRTELVYPPDDVFNPPLGEFPDYEYIILWMLKNNDYCEWADFSDKISESTLSGHLKKLRRRNYVDKPERNHYKITFDGIERLNELTYLKEKGVSNLRYPPKLIGESRNYEDIILWMLYHNESCRWSDFRDEDHIKINSSSLSNSLQNLQEDGLVLNENKEYKITSTGKSEYFKMLKKYDLDRQSILEEESKRIEEITIHMNEFYDKYGIVDDDVKFRFLNNTLKMNYSKVENMLEEKEDFNKILLFLSMNHPDQYPEYISPQIFAKKFQVKQTTLDFFIEKIIDENLYPVKFFRLEVFPDKEYYFQMNEKLERILKAVIDDYITKFTYLNKLSSYDREISKRLDISNLLNNIINEVCPNLFVDELKDSLRKFLPEYIKDLAYKIETEKKLITEDARREGFIYGLIKEEIQIFERSITKQESEEDIYHFSLDHSIFKALDVLQLNKSDFITTHEFRTLYEPENANIFSVYIGYLFKSIALFSLLEFDEALYIINEGLEIAANASLLCMQAYIQLYRNEYDKAVKIIDDVLERDPQNLLVLKTKIIIIMHYRKCCLISHEEDFELIDKIIKLNPKDKEFYILKAILLCITQRYKEAKKIIKKEVSLNLFNRKAKKVEAAATFILIYSYLAQDKYNKAVEKARLVQDLYLGHPIANLAGVLVNGYDLIYNFSNTNSKPDKFLNEIEIAISHEQNLLNRARYYHFKSIILEQIGMYEDAIEAIDNAIELVPKVIEYKKHKSWLFYEAKHPNEAFEMLDKLALEFPQEEVFVLKVKSFLAFKIDDSELGLEVCESLLKKYPNDHDILNNKAIFLANLNKIDEAKEIGKQLVSYDPNNGNYHDTYGEVLMRAEEYQDAIRELESALELNPLGWYIHDTYRKIGVCYKELGDEDKAERFFERAEKIKSKKFPSQRAWFGDEKRNEK